MAEEITRCPSCGKEIDKDSYVGKTKQFGRGRITTYAVVSCSCGKISRGPVLSDEAMRPRK